MRPLFDRRANIRLFCKAAVPERYYFNGHGSRTKITIQNGQYAQAVGRGSDFSRPLANSVSSSVA